MLPLSATVMRICRSFNLRRLPMRSVHVIAETPQMGNNPVGGRAR
jgi:hypothetical protein